MHTSISIRLFCDLQCRWAQDTCSPIGWCLLRMLLFSILHSQLSVLSVATKCGANFMNLLAAKNKKKENEKSVHKILHVYACVCMRLHFIHICHIASLLFDWLLAVRSHKIAEHRTFRLNVLRDFPSKIWKLNRKFAHIIMMIINNPHNRICQHETINRTKCLLRASSSAKNKKFERGNGDISVAQHQFTLLFPSKIAHRRIELSAVDSWRNNDSTESTSNFEKYA